jgi:large subunit ribosomal protein L13
MDMNKAFYLRKEDQNPQWFIIDANDKVLGRLATQVADILRGKDDCMYTPHSDSGDYVIVINAEKIKLTGKKWTDKEYERYTGYIGNKKFQTAREVLKKDATLLIKRAVKNMLPKNRLSRQIFKKLKVYTGSQHDHIAQQPKLIELRSAA